MKVGIRFLFLLAFSVQIAFGQSYNFDVYSLEQGLPQSQVTGVAEDSHGRLWVGTLAGGVSIFDGISFHLLPQFESRFKRVDKLLSSDDGKVYILSEGLTKLFEISDYDPDQIEEIELPINAFDGALMHQNTLYLISQEQGLYRLEDHQIKFVLEGTTQYGTDEKGQFFAMVKGKLFQIDQQRVIEKNFIGDIANVALSAQVQFYNGFVWFTNKDGLGRLNMMTKEIQILKKKDGFEDIETRTIDIIGGKLYVATEGKGFAIYERGRFNFYRLNNIANKNLFSGFYLDKHNRLWILGDGAGLILFKGKAFRHYSMDDGMSIGETWAIDEYQNEILVGTFGGGLYAIGDDQHIKEANQKFGIPSDAVVNKIYPLSNGDLFIGTHNGCFIYSKGKTVNILKDSDYADKRITDLAETKDGTIYLIIDSKRLYRYVNGSLSLVIDTQELNTNRLTTMLYHEDKLLIGGTDELFEYQILTNQFSRITDKVVKKEQLGFTTTLTPTKNGDLFIGSNRGLRLLKKNGELIEYDQEDGLASGTVFFLEIDHRGDVWIGSEKGVQRIHFNNKDKIQTTTLYNGRHGLKGVETNLHAVHQDSKGDLWFGTLEGVSCFRPGEEIINTSSPSCYLESIKLFYNEVDWTEMNFEVNDFGVPQNLILNYDNNNLTFLVHATNLYNPEAVRYQFQLEGADKDWLPVTTNSEITYSNLPPGNYTLRYKAVNENNFWSKEYTYTFEITPPFWQKGWFKLLILFVITSSTIGVVKYRERKLRIEKELLQSKVNERTKEILEQKEMIEDQKEELEKKSAEITESIEYAKKIQNNILPNHECFKMAFSEFFILFKPKDIVSGDFYWSHHKGDWLYVASIDCTGHGVPGALMSIISHNLLELVYAAHNEETISTADMLTAVKNKMQNFKDDAYDGNKLRDGMTISMMAFNTKTKELRFSGSYTGLYYVSNNQLEELKGHKIPIGHKTIINKDLAFEEAVVQLSEGDMVYLSSDGFPDQVGGPKKKKFFYGPFRDLLFSVSHLPADEQKSKIWKTFQNWKGNHEQYDDVMVMGFRV